MIFSRTSQRQSVATAVIGPGSFVILVQSVAGDPVQRTAVLLTLHELSITLTTSFLVATFALLNENFGDANKSYDLYGSSP